MAKLYELSDMNRSIWENIEAALDDPEIDWDAAEADLKQIEQEFDGKVENCAKLIVGMNGESESIAAEIERLTARRRALDNKVKRFKEYVKNEMIYSGRDKVKTNLFTIAVQNSPASLKVFNEADIPPEYFTVIPETTKLDAAAVKTALKDGKQIPGAELFVDTHLRIR
ncbi:siphovirus Gp157 family protein [Pyramidobacter piscolens]|uniref:siphovirus Gp157 family protein n=1 Tax=Pyramidobacter piscolens TaxID=638849 RepID=UPI002666C99C|nr:siphovirus Gp157 family protein [Pyramidobacter piscolens]